MNKKLASLLLSSALTLASTPAFADEPPPALPLLPVPQGYGVNVHFDDEQSQANLDFLKKSGMGWVRRDMFWGEVERVKGTYDFSRYDRFIDAMHGAGIRLVMIFDYGNPNYDGGNSPVSDEARAAYSRFAVAAVQRYAGKVDAWEIFNEPNIGFWKPKPDADQYVALANDATAAIRKAAPNAVIVGPGLAGPYMHDPFTGRLWPTYAFLETVLASDAAHAWSAITIHPYRPPESPPETTMTQIDNVRTMMKDHDIDPDKIPVIASEWGYSSFKKGVDESTQAAYAVRSDFVADIERMPFNIWYDWQDDSTDFNDKESSFGLLRHGTLWSGEWESKSMKPAFQAVQQLDTLLKGYKFDSLIQNDSSIMVVRYVKGAQAAYAAWSVDNALHTASIALPAGKWKASHILGNIKDITAVAGQTTSVAIDKTPTIIAPVGTSAQ